jgi:very-short-patch-repair endonuclease
VTHLSRSLMSRMSTRWGVVTLTELHLDGLTTSAVRRHVCAGMLVRMHAGVYRIATSPASFEARCLAACLADDDAVVGGFSAARWWQFRHVPVIDEPEVLVEHDRTPLARGVRLRRTNAMTSDDIVTRNDGIRLTAPPRTWFDCAKYLDDGRFEKLTEWVLDRHVGVPTLWATGRRLAGRGRSGSARVGRVMSQRADWQRPAGSGLEVDVFRALHERGVAPLVRQHPLRLRNGVVIHPDIAVPPIRWAVEIDHVTWHGGRFEAQRDKARDRHARRIGWQVDRVTDQELRASFHASISELCELFHLRCAALAA